MGREGDRMMRNEVIAIVWANAALELRHPPDGRPAWFATHVAQTVRTLSEDKVEVRHFVEFEVGGFIDLYTVVFDVSEWSLVVTVDRDLAAIDPAGLGVVTRAPHAIEPQAFSQKRWRFVKEQILLTWAKAAADAALDRRHPLDSRPHWFAQCVERGAKVIGEGKVKVRFFVWIEAPLEPGEAWEESPSGRWLVRTDPATGQRSVAITCDRAEALDVFTVVFDASSAEVAVVQERDLATIDPADLAALRYQR